MRAANRICPRTFWTLTKDSAQDIYGCVGKEKEKVTVYNVKPAYDLLEDVWATGATQDVILPEEAVLQNLMMDLDFTKMPDDLLGEIYSEAHPKTEGSILMLRLLYMADEEDVLCSITCLYFTGREIKTLTLGTFQFSADQDEGCFLIAPCSTGCDLVVSDDTLDFETAENLTCFAADLWNGLQHKFEESPKALRIRIKELLKERKEERE